MDQPRPWWREPWPWILLAGPLAALVACAVTIYLAVTQFGGQDITEGARKRGLVVEPVAAPRQPAGQPADAAAPPAAR